MTASPAAFFANRFGVAPFALYALASGMDAQAPGPAAGVSAPSARDELESQRLSLSAFYEAYRRAAATRSAEISKRRGWFDAGQQA